MSQYRIADRARADLLEVWEFIAEDNVTAADNLLSLFDQRFATLAELPRLGRERSDLAPGLRYFVLRNYGIFYRPVADGIEIVRVLHLARDIDPTFL